MKVPETCCISNDFNGKDLKNLNKRKQEMYEGLSPEEKNALWPEAQVMMQEADLTHEQKDAQIKYKLRELTHAIIFTYIIPPILTSKY